MRTYRARAALVAALMLVLIASASAGATTTGIRIFNPPLVTQRGQMRFVTGLEAVVCNVTMTKTLRTEALIPVNPVGLTKLGRITSRRVPFECGARILNLPNILGGLPAPGPAPNSWNLSFLSSDLATGELKFGILDFQVSIDQLNGECLYRGPLLGTLNAAGTILRYGSPLPLFAGGPECAPMMFVEGIFANEPPIVFQLLRQEV